ncbi:MAG: LytTR family DNA-binding domain-containing protein [Paracoccaceae bacterium]|nr:LytTR family DNA-binding domain-containing protein [Paracoccaceae bacterium]
MRSLKSSIHLRYVAAIVVTAALMIWISVNEEGSRDAIPGQVAFWSVAITAGWLQMILIARGVRASFGTERWPGWALLVATAIIGAVPLTFEVRWLLDTIVAPPQGLPPPWLTYLNVSVINLVFCLVQYLLIERWPLFEGAEQQEPLLSVGVSPEESDKIRPTIGHLSRRPEGLSGTIQYMRMEDHYLRVFTDEGDGMTLHRMSDATRDLAETDGMQVHKSWWVSAAAIDEILQENRKRIIRTKDGAKIPVGRSFEGDLRDAGWT